MADHTGDADLSAAGTSTLAPTVGWHAETSYVSAESEATLTPQVGWTATATFSAFANSALDMGSLFSQTSPFPMSGTGNNITIPPNSVDPRMPVGEKWLSYTAPFSGSLLMSVTEPEAGVPLTYAIYDADSGELVQDDHEGDLGLVLTAGDRVLIKLTDPESESGLVDGGLTLNWTYAARESSRLQVIAERTTVLETPGAFAINISNGYPDDIVTFSALGPTTALDFQEVQLDAFGVIENCVVYLPALQAGTYVLHCESRSSGTEEITFVVLSDPLAEGEEPTAEVPPAFVVQRWTFYEARNQSVTWTLQRNPQSWTSMFPPNNLTHAATTAPDGQALTWEGGDRPWRMEFRGYLDDEAEYERFVIWSEKRRRLWLIDHRNRAWLVTLESFDAQARIQPNEPWAHDYTVRALIFKQGTD